MKTVKYRILKPDRRILNAGTGIDSWFTLEKARELVDRDAGQMIYESDGVIMLWEVFWYEKQLNICRMPWK